MSAFREPLFILRDARPDEASVSCNGCAEGPVIKVLEVGSQMRDGRGSTGTEYRMCLNCLRLFIAAVAKSEQDR